MSNSCVRKLFDKGGKLITNLKLILSELYDFYTELYSNREGVLTKAECFKGLQTFKNGTSPGNDGLTAEFYQVFWPTLGHLLVDSLNSSFEKGEFASSQKQGILKLIEKKNKDKRYVANWRPISLLNVDVKIVSKAITLRFEKVLSDLISADQCTCVKGRNIFDAVRTIGDIMNYIKLYNLPGLMVTIDFEKAFDSLSWNFLFKNFLFNFGESVIKWVRFFFTNIIMNNGVATPLFSIGRGGGMKQGDPLLPYLFILTLETLLTAIRQNQDIKGIVVEDKEIKCIAFADDLTNVLRDKESYDSLSSLLNTHGECSGLQISKDKKRSLQVRVSLQINKDKKS